MNVILDEALEVLRETIDNEIESVGLVDWALNASGDDNIVTALEDCSSEELKELRDEIKEGASFELTIDLSGHILGYVKEILSNRVRQNSLECDDDEEIDDLCSDYDNDWLDDEEN